MKQISDEKFLKYHGWKYVKGYAIDREEINDFPDNYESIFFENPKDVSFIRETWFWKHEEFEEWYDDKDLLLETHYEEYMDEEGNLYDEMIQEKLKVKE